MLKFITNVAIGVLLGALAWCIADAWSHSMLRDLEATGGVITAKDILQIKNFPMVAFIVTSVGSFLYFQNKENN